MNAVWTACMLVVLGAEPAEPPSTPAPRLYVRTIPPGARVLADGKELDTADGLFLAPRGTGSCPGAIE